MHITDLWTAWPVAGPWQLSPLTGGTNNLIWRAETLDKQCYVLRIIPNLTNITRLRYEIALLEALSNQPLPFRLPLPLKTYTEDRLVQFEQETGTPAIAILSPLLPGHAADRNDLATTSHAAITLAQLDHALETLPAIQLPPGFQPLPTFGDLTRISPLIPDPLAALERLPIEHDLIQQIRLILTIVQEKVPDLYSRLPQQLLHCDYDPSIIAPIARRTDRSSAVGQPLEAARADSPVQSQSPAQAVSADRSPRATPQPTRPPRTSPACLIDE